MPALKVPELYYAGFENLLRLDDSTMRQLIAVLKEVEPTLTIKHLASQVSEKLPQIPIKEIEEILPAIVSLYALRDRTDWSVSEITRAIVDSIQSAKNLSKPEGWEFTRFSQDLDEILNVGGALTIVAKAAGVLTDHQRMFCDARILSDIRPVFDSGDLHYPGTAVIIHTLKIGYHEDAEHKEFFVALTTEDVHELLKVLERASSKTQFLKSAAEKADFSYLDVENSE